MTRCSLLCRCSLGLLIACALSNPALCAATRAPQAASHEDLGVELGMWTVIPFGLLLLAIAVLPLAAGHWWERNKNKGIVAFCLAAPIAAYLAFAHGEIGAHVLLEKAREYSSFIILLAALFVISGGICVRGSLSGTPLVNTAILGFGAVIANVIGTTGASVLLIRPLLRANAPRQNKVHVVVFFIFLVSNCGGLLTPLGDPPLFLGFLKGVPFEWTFTLWKEWCLVCGLVLLLFSIWDQVVFNREEERRPGSQLEEVMHHVPLRVTGLVNAVFLLAVMATILAAGSGLGYGGRAYPYGIQEAAMVAIAAAAYRLTPAANRAENRFTFAPIVEVAVLFAGIFVTMAPALLILNAWGQGHREVLGMDFGVQHPWQYFWATGALSSFLDNAPTYLTFAATACGKHGVPVEGRYLEEFLTKGPEAAKLLAAISCGAVMMGAMTYIGNGPNFMVKAIAEENGVRMPSFAGYMGYSCVILLPVFAVITLVFFL